MICALGVLGQRRLPLLSDMKRNFGQTKEKNIPREVLEQYKCFQDSSLKIMKAIHQD